MKELWDLIKCQPMQTRAECQVSTPRLFMMLPFSRILLGYLHPIFTNVVSTSEDSRHHWYMVNVSCLFLACHTFHGRFRVIGSRKWPQREEPGPGGRRGGPSPACWLWDLGPLFTLPETQFSANAKRGENLSAL